MDEIEKIERSAKSLIETAFEIDKDVKIKIGDFEVTKDEIENVLLSVSVCADTYASWYPHESLSVSAFTSLPRRVIREFVVAAVVELGVQLSRLEPCDRTVGLPVKTFMREQLLRFKIDSIEIREKLEECECSDIWIDTYLNFLYT